MGWDRNGKRESRSVETGCRGKRGEGTSRDVCNGQDKGPDTTRVRLSCEMEGRKRKTDRQTDRRKMEMNE